MGLQPHQEAAHPVGEPLLPGRLADPMARAGDQPAELARHPRTAEALPALHHLGDVDRVRDVLVRARGEDQDRLSEPAPEGR